LSQHPYPLESNSPLLRFFLISSFGRSHYSSFNTINYNANVTDLINALPGNSSVKTVQKQQLGEAVFSVSALTSRSGGWWSRDMCLLWCASVPRLYKWQNSFGLGAVTSQS
jgi:hypothetical protein